MPGEESVFQAQRKTRPAIEAVIGESLEGARREAALAFVAYLRANKMPPAWASANSWKVSYKGKGVCYIKLGNGGWRVLPLTDHTQAFDAFVRQEGLCEIIWRNLALCTRCHPNTCAPKGEADTFTGVQKTFFGKACNNICRGGSTTFRNPDAEAINCLKKMLDFRRQTIVDGTVPKVAYVSQKRRANQA